jgi:hypothetical protein
MLSSSLLACYEIETEVFENRGLRRIYESERDEVEGGWIKLHNVDLHNLCFSPNIRINSRRIGWACVIHSWNILFKALSMCSILFMLIVQTRHQNTVHSVSQIPVINIIIYCFCTAHSRYKYIHSDIRC